MAADPYRVTIQDLQRAQYANAKLIVALDTKGDTVLRSTQVMTVEGHRYAIAMTHIDTGALRASHRMSVTPMMGEVFLDTSATNPRTGAKTSVYGVIEHNRGGEHAFYDRTADERGDYILALGERVIMEDAASIWST